jgi:hypothetical protein
MSGNVKAFSSTVNFSILNDPNPSPGGNFGGGYTAVGNVVDESGQFRNELLIGQSNLGEPGNPDLIGAVHFFDPLKAQVLQTIRDPDLSPASRFGSDVISLGDINGDGFLDFAVAAPSFNGPAGAGQGRIYLFRSDNSPLPAPRPVVTHYALTNKVFVVGAQSTPIVGSAAKASSHKIGTTFSYTLSEAATAKLAIAELVPGRREGNRCVAPTPRLTRAKKCSKRLGRGTLTRSSHAGVNEVAFSGRIGSKALQPGHYSATLTATTTNATSAPVTVSFTVVGLKAAAAATDSILGGALSQVRALIAL